MRKLVLILALCAGPVGAQSLFLDGNDLYSLCTVDTNELKECWGYTAGVADSLTYTAGYARTHGAETIAEVCIPGGVPQRQIADIVVKFLEERPDLRHAGAANLVHTALYDAFPCD